VGTVVAVSGYFAIGISHTKTPANVGTLWRSAHLFGAAFCFTVGARYKQQPSDTMKTWRSIPLLNFATIADLRAHLPFDCMLVGVELDAAAQPIEAFAHPPRAVYLLGAEDHGLKPDEVAACHRLVRLPGERSMNVAAAGTVVLYDRHLAKSAGAISWRKACAAE
jgi:tRNA G18 (ribose-2'-O)-methylase SpoU